MLGGSSRGLKPDGSTSEARLSGEAPAALPLEGVLNPNNGEARLSGEAPRKDLKQRTRELLIYSGLPRIKTLRGGLDQQAWMEGALKPQYSSRALT